MDFRRIRKNFKFSSNELIRITIVSLIFGVLFSFRKWGDSVVDYNSGLENLAIYSILSFIALIIHFGVEKIYACNKGIETEYKTNPYLLGIGLYVALLFNGFLYVLGPGYLSVKTKKEKRIGKWKYRAYFNEYSLMAISGIISNLILSGFLIGFTSNSLITSFIFVNLMVSAFSLLPIPFSDGFHILCASVYHYVFVIVFALTFSILLIKLNVIYSAIFGVVGGFLGIIYWFIKSLNNSN